MMSLENFKFGEAIIQWAEGKTKIYDNFLRIQEETRKRRRLRVLREYEGIWLLDLEE